MHTESLHRQFRDKKEINHFTNASRDTRHRPENQNSPQKLFPCDVPDPTKAMIKDSCIGNRKDYKIYK